MKKYVGLIVLVVSVIMLFGACGKSYTCAECDKKTRKAYYGVEGNIESVMCEACAVEYWVPLDYERYRVKK